MFDKLEAGMKKTADGAWGWVKRHPVLSTVAGTTAVLVTAPISVPLAVGVSVVAGTSVVAANIAKTDGKKSDDKNSAE